jgi:hypothetical protein
MRISTQLVGLFKGLMAVSVLTLVGPLTADSADKANGVRVGPNRQVSAARKATAHYEVVIACDPKDAKTLVIASMASVSPNNINLHEIATFASSDGGITWEITRVQKGQLGNESYFDPHLAYDADGSVYMAAIRNNPSKANAGAIEIARSSDGARTWGRQTALRFADRPFLVADRTGGKGHGMLYCFATKSEPLAAVSRDGGKSFTDWKSLLTTARPFGMGNAVILSDGALVVSYPLPREIEKYPCPVNLTIARSTDGGQTYQEAPTVAECTLRDIGLPSLAVDATNSAFKDRLYLVWPDHTTRGQRVLFSRSVDRGKTWSRPTVLSEQIEEGDAANLHDAFLPAVAVNNAGVVGVIWYDGRDLPPKTTGWNIRFRASHDGGETWPSSVRVTEENSVFMEGANLTWAGDTAGLAADADGDFHAAWIDNRTGVRQVWTAAIRANTKPPNACDIP